MKQVQITEDSVGKRHQRQVSAQKTGISSRDRYQQQRQATEAEITGADHTETASRTASGNRDN